jgi:regulator of sigma E protease
MPGFEAQKIGLRAGDAIVSINGRAFTSKSGPEMVELIHSSIGKPLALVVDRGPLELHIKGVPQADPDNPGVGVLGFKTDTVLGRVSVVQSIQDGNTLTYAWLQAMGHLVTQHNLKTIRKDAGGPVYIVEVTNEAVKYGPGSILLLLGQLRLSLAVFNLLPIPILDGGHLLLFVIEAVRRGKKLTMEQQQNFMLAGLAIIGVLFVLILFNDITRSHLPQ